MPDWMKHIREHLPLAEFRGEVEGDLVEELAGHLEDTYREAVARGATEKEATSLALAEIEDWDRLARDARRTRRGSSPSKVARATERSEEALRERGGSWVSVANALQELRFTFRRLGKVPGFTAVTLLTLAVGLGSITAIYSVVKAVLLDPLPYPDAERLVAVWNTAPGMGEDLLPQSLAVNAVYEDDARVFDEVGVWYPQTIPAHLAETPEELSAIAVTDGALRALGVQPFLGRGFTAEDIDAASPGTVILSHDFWLQRMGADPGALGSTLRLGSSGSEIIGVMPEGFRFLDRSPDLYLSFQYDRATLDVSNFTFQGVARLKEGTSLEAALADMTRLVPVAPERYPGGATAEFLREAGAAPVLHPLKDDLVGSVGKILWVILGGVGIILLVACANVANLLLVRGESRERVMAVQSALGAPRGRVAAQLLSESVVLSVLGGVLGTGMAWAGLRLLRSAGPAQLPRLQEIGLDSGTFLLALALSILAGVALGVLPLVRTWRMDLAGGLKEGGRGFGGSRKRNRIRNTLVVAQLALALVLLVGSGLMIRSFVALSRVKPGYVHPEEILTFRLTIGSAAVRDPAEVPTAHEIMAGRLAEIPGVTAVGLSTSTPMDHAAGFDPIFVEDFPLPEGQQARIRRFKWVGGGYHEALGNPVIAGRTITWDDIRHRLPVVMITEGMAREYWGDPAQAIGRRIGTGYGPGDWREIIGVVGDQRDDGLEQPAVDIVYWPMLLEHYWTEQRGDALFVARTMGYVVRSSRVGTPGFLDEVRGVVRAAYPDRPLSNVSHLADVERDSVARTSFTLVMLAIAAVVGVLLGSVGLYGVISYTVGQRTRELGLRMAMGAQATQVTTMVLRQGLLLGAVGAVVGLGAAAGATRLMEALLFGVSPVDPLTYGVVAVALLAVSLLATWLPAHRAAGVDPMVALRAE